MSNRRRKLTLRARPGGFGELPAADDPWLPRLVSVDGVSGKPRWWVQVPPGLATPPVRARHSAATHVGLRRRRNEDVPCVDIHRGLYAVCDGVGGRPHGDIAAQEAAAAIQGWIGVARPPGAAAWAEDAVADASRLVYESLQCAAQALHRRACDDPGLAKMGTSASMVLVQGNFAVIGQVGDSRVYLARGEHLIQLTEDHTLRSAMIRGGHAWPETGRSGLWRSIGCRPTVAADVMALPLVAGDRLLLCTDGLHSTLAEDDLLALFELDVADAALAAIGRANALGGPDNVTAIFVELAA